MYIHLLPEALDKIGLNPVLKKITIPELSLELDRTNFNTKSPYPHKGYKVGAIPGRKAMVGLIIKTKKTLDLFTTIYEWESNHTIPIIHTIKNIVEPNEEVFDFVSQDILLNIGMDNLKSRVHKDYEGMSPLNTKPIMYLNLEEDRANKRKSDSITINKLDMMRHYISERKDTIKLHTIESERLEKSYIYPGRYPKLETAIIVD